VSYCVCLCVSLDVSVYVSMCQSVSVCMLVWMCQRTLHNRHLYDDRVDGENGGYQHVATASVTVRMLA